jgi:tetratricopeptide (TPR) repeat protein
VLQKQGRIAEAFTHYERSLAIRLKVHGTEEHPEVARFLGNMGGLLQEQGRYSEAVTHYERSLAIYIKVQGTEEHPDVADSLMNIGNVLQDQGRFAEAATHYERSLAIYIKVHGTEEHPDVANSLSDMGAVLWKQGRIAEAFTHYERSLAILIKVHGTEEHPDVARTRRNLEALRDLMSGSRIRRSVWTFSGKPKRGNRLPNPSGLRFFRKPKLSFKPFLSNAAPALPDNPEHPDVSGSLIDLGMVLEDQGRHAEAATHYERSLAIYIKVHGTEEHSDVGQTRRNLESLRDVMAASSAMQRLNVDTTAGTFTNASTEKLHKRRIVKARRSGGTSAAAPDVPTATPPASSSVSLKFSVAAASGGGFVFGSTCRAETGASTPAPPAASPAPVIRHTPPPTPSTFTFTAPALPTSTGTSSGTTLPEFSSVNTSSGITGASFLSTQAGGGGGLFGSGGGGGRFSFTIPAGPPDTAAFSARNSDLASAGAAGAPLFSFKNPAGPPDVAAFCKR